MRYVQDKTDEKKARVFLFILLVIFVLGLIFTIPAYGQKKVRQYNADVNKFIDSYYLNEPMKFSKVAGDTFLVTLRADCIDGENYGFKAVVFFPKGKEIKFPYNNLRIEFDELKACTFYPRIINRIDNCIEYSVSLDQLAYLRYNKPTATCVEDMFCSRITWGQSVFSDFLSEYLK